MESNLPISVHYTYYALPVTDNTSSEEETERSGSKRRRHSQDHDETLDFWQNNYATLPESMTRVPRTEVLRNQQHLKMLNMLHTGKANLVATRAELEILKHQMQTLKQDADKLRGEKLELQIKSDMLERKVRSSPEMQRQSVEPATGNVLDVSDNDTNVGASTSKGTKVKEEYQIPEGFDRNESIFKQMADTTFQRIDPAIVAARKGSPNPKPLMSIKVTPPQQGTKRARDDNDPKDDGKAVEGFGNFWNVTGRGPFVLHTHSKPKMDNVGPNVVGHGGVVGVSQGHGIGRANRIVRGLPPYGRGYGVAGPVAFTGIGRGHGQTNRPTMGTAGISRGIGFKISPPKLKLPSPIPNAIPNVFETIGNVTTSPATTTTMTGIFTNSGSSSSAVAGSSSSSGTAKKDAGGKTKKTRPTKKMISPSKEEKSGDPGSDSDHSVLRLDLSEHDEAFIRERGSDHDLMENESDFDLPDYEDAY